MSRPAGTKRVHADRDRLIHFSVEWIVGKTGLPIGAGFMEPAEPDACLAAAWLLSGGMNHSDFFFELKPPVRAAEHASDGQVTAWYERWIDQASLYRFLRVHAITDAAKFRAQFDDCRDTDALLAQLRKVTAPVAYNAYRAVRKTQRSAPMRERVRKRRIEPLRRDGRNELINDPE